MEQGDEAPHENLVKLSREERQYLEGGIKATTKTRDSLNLSCRREIQWKPGRSLERQILKQLTPVHGKDLTRTICSKGQESSDTIQNELETNCTVQKVNKGSVVHIKKFF